MRMVALRILQTKRVMTTPSTRKPVSPRAARALLLSPGTRKAVSRKISAPKRPLQGMKLLVATASFRSRGESMIRQPTTPAALHPRPMHMDRAIFPQPPHFSKLRSRL